MKDQQKSALYCPPQIISISVAPDITKCMQNTGGTEDRSTFRMFRKSNHLKKKSKENKLTGIASTRLLRLTIFLILMVSTLMSVPTQSIIIPILIPQRLPVIQEIVDGINKGFEELGYKPADLQTVIKDVQGLNANISTIIDAAIQKRPALIITITTGLSKTTVDHVLGAVPVVFSGVTDPVGAGIVADLNNHGKITGASDLWPIEEQIQLILRILPKAKNVGVIFRPSEPNSQFGMQIARRVAKKLDLNLVERGVEDSREVVAVLDAILPQVDAVYIGPDNMTIELAKVIVESSAQARKPVFGGEPGTLEKGAIGVVSIPYFDLGRETAKLCDIILKGTPTEQIPIYVAKHGFIGLNFEAAARLNIAIPEEVRQNATKTIGIYKEVPLINQMPKGMLLILVGAIVLVLIVAILSRRKKHRDSTRN